METLVIFGASKGGERALRSLGRGQRAVAFADNDRKKHGSRLKGLPVVSPEALKEMAFDRIVIASAWYAEIFDQLVSQGIEMDRIDVLDADILDGSAEQILPQKRWIALGGAIVAIVVALAIYGAYRLVMG